MKLLYDLFGYMMQFCCKISFNYYVLALFLFALIIQILLFPLGIKQQKSSVLMAKMRPKELAIRKKYSGRKDKASSQKMQMEIQELYKQEGYSVFSGCLPLLIQLPIIFALFAVVRQPLTYSTDIEKKDVEIDKTVISVFYDRANDISNLQLDFISDARAKTTDEKTLNKLNEYEKKAKSYIKDLANSGNKELALADMLDGGVDDFYGLYQELGMKIKTLEDVDASVVTRYNPYSVFEKSSDIFSVERESTLMSLEKDARSAFTFDDLLEKYSIDESKMPNYVLVGDYSTLQTPSLSNFNLLMLIPLLIFVSSYFSGVLTRKLTVQPLDAQGVPQGSTGFMTWGLPLMSTFFSFQFPVAVGIYWIYRSIFAVGQQYLLSKLYPIPVATKEQMEAAEIEVKQKKTRKKVLLIEVDEDDKSYDDLVISEEKAEKIKRRQEKARKAIEAKLADEDNNNDDENTSAPIEKAQIKDESFKKKDE